MATHASSMGLGTEGTGAGAWTRLLLRTSDDRVAFGLRVTLALVMFPHGAQKLFGWFGGYGFAGTMGFFTDTMHIPAPLAFLAIMAESVGAIALLLGFTGRIAAFGIAVNMAVAALTSHVGHGFFMNWFGNQKGEGFEYHLLAIALALAVVLKGSGRWSVDRALTRG